jgi:mRNA interferase MazF
MRGEIWLVNLDPTVGNEIRKTRPCVVASPAEMHDHLRTVMVAAMTTKSRAAHLNLEHATRNLH